MNSPPSEKVAYFKANFDTLQEFSSTKYQEDQEINLRFPTYKPLKKNLNFIKFKRLIQKAGLNPLLSEKQVNFDESVASRLVDAKKDSDEPIQKEVIKNYLKAQQYMSFFNNDMDIVMVSDIEQLKKTSTKIHVQKPEDLINDLKEKHKEKKMKNKAEKTFEKE